MICNYELDRFDRKKVMASGSEKNLTGKGEKHYRCEKSTYK